MGCSRNSYYSSSVVGKQHRKEMRQNMRQVDSFCRRITVWSESLKVTRLLRVLMDLFHLLSSRNFCLPISRT